MLVAVRGGQLKGSLKPCSSPPDAELVGLKAAALELVPPQRRETAACAGNLGLCRRVLGDEIRPRDHGCPPPPPSENFSAALTSPVEASGGQSGFAGAEARRTSPRVSRHFADLCHFHSSSPL